MKNDNRRGLPRPEKIRLVLLAIDQVSLTGQSVPHGRYAVLSHLFSSGMSCRKHGLK